VRILYWGTYDIGKPRIRLLREGLRSNGVVLNEIHTNIWEGIEDKSQLRGFWQQLRILLRWLFSYPRMLWWLARAERPDLIMVSFPGVLDVLLAAPVARLRGIPLVWDMFMSIYDTVVEDRKLLLKTGLLARMLHAVERFALLRADLVFLDTNAHARRVEKLFGIETGTFGAVWVGAESAHFHPMPSSPASSGTLSVLFYGQFIPLHGIETIVRAARLTCDEPIEWQLIGKGQEADRIKTLIAEQPLPKLQWDEWVDYAQLPQRIASADVCLGIFGTTEKAASVIPNKVFQIVAMGKPLITRDSPAIRELLDEAFPCAQLISPANPEALAQAVRACAKEQASMALHCHTALLDRLGSEAIGQQCISLLTSHFELGS
jgi:glycosyltransferase involved in cell wall biosynthesis